MLEIVTASWFTRLPANIVRIGISRGSARGQTGFRKYMRLAPGPYHQTATIPEYLERYGAQLSALNPEHVVEDIRSLSSGAPAALLCFEPAQGCNDGKYWCHRHMVAQWLEDHLGIDVPEYEFPDLDRFAHLRMNGVPAPKFND